MNLPNYFIADLPPEHAMTPTLITEACQTLKRNREQYLVRHSTNTIIGLLSATAQSWIEADNPFRKLALDRGVSETNFSQQTIARGLDAGQRVFYVQHVAGR